MKIGVVKHLNARPLTYGFETDKKHEILYENPSVLKDLLLEKKLDIALISSIECIRNSDVLAFSNVVGVCAKDKVRSILFFKNKTESYPPDKVFVDSGSRSSVALLKVILKMETGKDVETIATNPNEIVNKISQNQGSHLLFGDNALHATWDKNKIEAIDLATWWNRISHLSFCFAFWAFSKNQVFADDLFLKSLEYGLEHIDEIINNHDSLQNSLVRKYLTQELHYKVSRQDLDGFYLFQEKCKTYGYL
ncbi:MAG: ABC transporter substrate-binding protein [Leptospiraceae bacterium]|nr:ABC transporter substrate-binding protein [Leptospiraceae bacterium]MCP5494149.1 ABC transporter substrate-binding protein [Leptospiraceae bacterium]